MKGALNPGWFIHHSLLGSRLEYDEIVVSVGVLAINGCRLWIVLRVLLLVHEIFLTSGRVDYGVRSTG